MRWLARRRRDDDVNFHRIGPTVLLGSTSSTVAGVPVPPGTRHQGNAAPQHTWRNRVRGSRCDIAPGVIGADGGIGGHLRRRVDKQGQFSDDISEIDISLRSPTDALGT